MLKKQVELPSIALMSVASTPHEEYLYILAVNQRWKCT